MCSVRFPHRAAERRPDACRDGSAAVARWEFQQCRVRAAIPRWTHEATTIRGAGPRRNAKKCQTHFTLAFRLVERRVFAIPQGELNGTYQRSVADRRLHSSEVERV